MKYGLLLVAKRTRFAMAFCSRQVPISYGFLDQVFADPFFHRVSFVRTRGGLGACAVGKGGRLVFRRSPFDHARLRACAPRGGCRPPGGWTPPRAGTRAWGGY